MPLTISNNSGRIRELLPRKTSSLCSTASRSWLVKRIISPNDDPGTLSVVMKLNAAVNRMAGARNNVQNGISFVEIQTVCWKP